VLRAGRRAGAGALSAAARGAAPARVDAGARQQRRARGRRQRGPPASGGGNVAGRPRRAPSAARGGGAPIRGLPTAVARTRGPGALEAAHDALYSTSTTGRRREHTQHTHTPRSRAATLYRPGLSTYCKYAAPHAYSLPSCVACARRRRRARRGGLT
jgi:hypothetical protein